MIIKSLLFVIICIFMYETYLKLTKMNEEYFSMLDTKQDSFISMSDDPLKNDISQTIVKNCKAYKMNSYDVMTYTPDTDTKLDTLYYARFQPLEYNANRKYYWKGNKLVHEGIRRSIDDDTEIAKVQALLDAETNEDNIKILRDELTIFKWRKNQNNILSNTNTDDNTQRTMRDITTDYYPQEIGMNRPWIERHSHIPDYTDKY